jgi:Kef-type K+ transport system membrane component KefB
MLENLPFKIVLPITDPVLVFAIILFVILLAPLVLNKFRIPGIVGLILAGVVLGGIGIVLYASFFKDPETEQLEKKINYLETKIETFNRKIDTLELFATDLERRD